MECRAGCGACCISPSIVQSYYGMPNGKKAGERCVHLTADYLCALFGDERRPLWCRQFQAEEWACGLNREQALTILADLEQITLNSPKE